MIEPGELHRYFKVREVTTGRDVWLLGGDTRYEVTGDNRDGLRFPYRMTADGEYFLAESVVHTHPWGRLMKLEEVEPLPDGKGIYAVPDGLKLAMTYEGSWRQYADSQYASGRESSCAGCKRQIVMTGVPRTWRVAAWDPDVWRLYDGALCDTARGAHQPAPLATADMPGKEIAS